MLKKHRVGGVMSLGITKKVSLSGEVRLGSYRMARLGDLMSHNLICFSSELKRSLPRYSAQIPPCIQFHWLRLGSSVV